ncbi:ATP-binding protein [Hymenobacter gummosus]|uniref:ATP-binding protein n=1 Tax=Hymenobacter gummosus TaxID=1776032 RepID=A0A3S0JAJ0_9BACT|nr:ATP-binding protein [Hymenobacter gummosus]RTQ45466.1 ATP-binding protein [Hymenobacter gummosus]
MKLNGVAVEKQNRFLLAARAASDATAIGQALSHLELLPDGHLLLDTSKAKMRLNFNQDCVGRLCEFNKGLYERLSGLPIGSHGQALRQELGRVLRAHDDLKSAARLTAFIAERYPALWFENWPIAELQGDLQLRLTVEEIKGAAAGMLTPDENGELVLRATVASPAKLKLKLSTDPKPDNVAELTHFRADLMHVVGAGQYECIVPRFDQWAVTRGPRNFRVRDLKFDANALEPGYYFLRLYALDKLGNVLNTNDDFADPIDQAAWERLQADNPDADRSLIKGRWASDSAVFYFYAEDEINPDEPPISSRREKISSVLQSFFRYRLDLLGKATLSPQHLAPEPSEWGWLTDATRSTTSHFQIKYAGSPYNFQLAVSSKLRLAQQAILQHPESLGRLELRPPTAGQPVSAAAFSTVPSALQEHPAAAAFVAARRTFFTLITHQLPSHNGIWETFDLPAHQAAAHEYVQAYARLLATLQQEQARWAELNEADQHALQAQLLAVQQLDLVSLSGRLPDTQERYAALLVSPLHPLRLGWQLGLLDLFERWEQLTRDNHSQQWTHWTEEVKSLFFGLLQPTNHPLLVGDESGQPFEYAGELCFGWGVLTRTAPVDVSDLSAGSSRSLVQYLQQILDLRGTASVIENDVDPRIVYEHLQRYLALHPYTEQLTINIFNPGEGQVFQDVLLELERTTALHPVRYEIRLFTSQRSLVQEGEAFTRLLNPATSQTEEAESFSQPARNGLFPKLRLSINPTEEFVRDPASFDAHLSFLVNPFPLSPKIHASASDSSAFFLEGLVVEPVVDFASAQAPETYAWTRYVPPYAVLPTASPARAAVATAFAHLSQFTAACLAGKPTSALPATELRLNSRETVLIDNIHSHSDWVVTFDRHLGPELFDLPVTAGQTPFLLDYVPGKQFLGVSTFLTSKPGAELEHLLAPVVQTMVGPLTTTTVASQSQLILNDLRAVSGSLVMKLSSQPTESRIKEYAGLALAKRLLEKQGLLQQQFIIPLDLHLHLFQANAAGESSSRADMLLVDVDVAIHTIHLQVVEVKTRTSLTPALWQTLCQDMDQQITNTIDHLQRRFEQHTLSGHVRFDQVLRARELSELLLFYAARAERYELLAPAEARHLRHFLKQLPDQPYQLAFTRRGIVFNLNHPHRVERQEHGDTVFYRVGQPGILDLLNPDSEFNTRRPTPDWHRLPADLTRRAPAAAEVLPARETPSTVDALSAQPATPLAASGSSRSSAELPSTPVTAADASIGAPATAPPAAAPAPATPSAPPVELSATDTEPNELPKLPDFDVYIGDTDASTQFGMLGRTPHGQRVALDLNGTQTISLFGVQGAGKSYSIGTITEMVLQSIPHVNSVPKPLAGVIFHYSESQDYKPEFTSMVHANQKATEVNRLREWYEARPQGIEDVVLVVPRAKLAERQTEYPELRVEPLSLSSAELGIQDWRFLMGAVGSQALYMKHLNSIMRGLRGQLTLAGLRAAIQDSALLNTAQRELALSRLSLAEEYIDDDTKLGQLMAPGRLLVVDLRDEFLDQDDALGLFVIMLNIFANVRLADGQPFNKFIVFDEAHKYMGNEELTGSIVTAIREMRHKGVSLLIASQDPPSLPNAIIELSSIMLVHRFNSPQWLKHVQKSIVQFDKLTPSDLAQLGPGEAYLWASRATNKIVTQQPIKIVTRPRVTQHGGSTVKAAE